MELNCIPELEKKSVDELVSTFRQMDDKKKLSQKKTKSGIKPHFEKKYTCIVNYKHQIPNHEKQYLVFMNLLFYSSD